MLSRWLATGMDPRRVTVIDPGLPHFDGVRVLASLPTESPPQSLMLGIKPQLLDDVAPHVAQSIGPATTVFSILAGTRHGALTAYLPQAKQVVRIMPNLPVAIGQGAVVMFAPGGDRAYLSSMMAPLGLNEWLDDEALFDAVTALSGSGPAFLYRFAEAMARGGAAMGLDPEMADRLARATVAGASALALASKEQLVELADRVASKGGSTREGLDALEDGQGLYRLVEKALRAAEARNIEMGAGR